MAHKNACAHDLAPTAVCVTTCPSNEVAARSTIFPAEAKKFTGILVPRLGHNGPCGSRANVGVGHHTVFADMYYFEDAIAEETKAAVCAAVLGESGQLISLHRT